MNDFLANLKDKLKNGKTLFIIGMVGILLIFSSSFFTADEKTDTVCAQSFDTDGYRLQLEKSVKKLVQNIIGSRDVTVFITLEGGVRYTYANDSRQSSDSDGTELAEEIEQSYIIVTDSSGNQKALSVYEAYPEVRGVTVVYSGSSAYDEKIKSAVTAALGITSKRIFTVAKGGN